MAVETIQPGEQPRDPVQEARSGFNQELFTRDYTPGALVTKTLQLQNALLGSSTLTPDKTYHELDIVAGQAMQRALFEDDQTSVATLTELQSGFKATYEFFNKNEPAHQQPAQPTQTEKLPPMSSAKGGEVFKAPAKPKSQTTDKPTTQSTPEGKAAQPEESIGTFFSKKRTELGLSQSQLGKLVDNLSQANVSGLERGNKFSEDKLNSLIAALNLNEEDAQHARELYFKKFPQTPQQ